MKQVLRKGFKDMVVEELPDPLPSPHHVLVQPRYSLISAGTETASIKKEGVLHEVAHNPSHIQKVLDVMKANGPLRTTREVLAKFNDFAVLGYAGAGVVVGKHATVTDLAIGDRVAYGGEGTGHGECISTGRQLVARIPDGVGFDQACFATLGAIAMNGVRIAQIGLGETVVVIGLGLVGQLAAQLARLQGARVIAVDLRQERVDLAVRLGAEVGYAGGDAVGAVHALTEGRGTDCAIIAAAAKSSAPAELALQCCRDRGRIVVLGAIELQFPWLEMYLKEIQLFMARAYGPGSYDSDYERRGRDYPYAFVRWTENRNMEEFLRLASAGGVALDELISHRFALDDAAAAYDEIMKPASSSMAVVLKYPAADMEVDSYIPARKVEVHAFAAPVGAPRLALLGAANIARWAHMPALKTAGASLRAVQSGSGARAKAYARRFGAAYCVTDPGEIFSDPEVDAVIITSRNQKHAQETLSALRAGKHVFVEKPMCLTEDECREIATAARESGRHVAVGFNRRFAPDYVKVRQQLARRASPAVLNCRVNSPGISGDFWMADPAIGGAILGEACHFLDLFAWLLGSEPTEVSAFSLPTGRRDPIGENNVTAALRFEDGSIANLTYCTVGSAASAGERLEAFAPGLGLMTSDFKQVAISARTRRGSSRWFANKGYDEQMADFVAALRSGHAPATTVNDGVRATVACLRLMESCRDNGSPKPINWRDLTGA